MSSALGFYIAGGSLVVTLLVWSVVFEIGRACGLKEKRLEIEKEAVNRGHGEFAIHRTGGIGDPQAVFRWKTRS